METTLKNFALKTCYDYFQAYDVTLICPVLVRILHSNYMLYNIKKLIRNIVKNHTKTNVIFIMNYYNYINNMQ
jgi:hypothetical protein